MILFPSLHIVTNKYGLVGHICKCLITINLSGIHVQSFTAIKFKSYKNINEYTSIMNK